MAYSLKLFLSIANYLRDRRQLAYAQYVRDAVTAATEPTTPPVADYADATAWRTSGSSSPGPRLRLLTTVSGNDFYITTRRPRCGHDMPSTGIRVPKLLPSH